MCAHTKRSTKVNDYFSKVTSKFSVTLIGYHFPSTSGMPLTAITHTAITLGPLEAKEALREALAMGADEACLLTESSARLSHMSRWIIKEFWFSVYVSTASNVVIRTLGVRRHKVRVGLVVRTHTTTVPLVRCRFLV